MDIDSNNDTLLLLNLSSLADSHPRPLPPESVSLLGRTMRTDVLKSVLIVALLALTLIFSLIPFALRHAAIYSRGSVRRRHAYANVFSLLSCFGGGVFLATCLLDLLPDTRDEIGVGLERLNIKTAFPLAEFFVAIGFFLVLFIEQIVVWFREHGGTAVDVSRSRKHQQPASSVEDDDDDDRRPVIVDGNGDGGEAPPPTPPSQSSGASGSTATTAERRRHSVPAAVGQIGTLGTIGSGGGSRATRHRRQRHAAAAAAAAGVKRSTNPPPAIAESERSSTEQEPSPITNTPPNPEDGPRNDNENEGDTDSVFSDVHFDPDAHSTFRAIMLVMALSCHAAFEGLALGLQLDATTALQIFAALCIHKCVIAFSLGMRLVQSRLSNLAVVGCCLLFCLSTLIGGFIGVGITESVHSSVGNMINGSFQGVACGTFLYITAFEILPHELNDGGHRLLKLIMLVAGFALICTFVLVYPS